MKVKIIDYTHEGLGVAKKDNKVIFIPNTIKDKEYEIKIIDRKKNYLIGENIDNVNTTKCQYYLDCGSCDIRHLTYKQQCDFKVKALKETLKKQKINSNINKIIKNEEINHYRNKVMLPFGIKNKKIICGYFKNKSKDIVEIKECLLQNDLINNIINDIIKLLNDTNQSVYDFKRKKGNLRHLYIRYGKNTDEIMICFVCSTNKINKQKEIVKKLVSKYPNIKSIVINENKRSNSAVLGFKNYNLYNCNFIHEKIGNLLFRLEPNTFFQVNTSQMKKLYDEAKRMLDLNKDDLILDAYCGVGSIGLYFAKDVSYVYGVEINEKSIKMAEINQKNNNILNANFFVGDVNNIINKLDLPVNKIILDPPRSGLEKGTIDFLNKNKFEKVVYISCNPATLARDLNLLNTYDIIEITPVDMFSQTHHLECVCLLVKKGENESSCRS